MRCVKIIGSYEIRACIVSVVTLEHRRSGLESEFLIFISCVAKLYKRGVSKKLRTELFCLTDRETARLLLGSTI